MNPKQWFALISRGIRKIILFSDPVDRNGWYLSSWTNTNSIQTLSQVSLKIMIIRLLKLKFLLFSNSFSDQTLIHHFISIVLLSFLFYYFTRFSLILLLFFHLLTAVCKLGSSSTFYFSQKYESDLTMFYYFLGQSILLQVGSFRVNILAAASLLSKLTSI